MAAGPISGLVGILSHTEVGPRMMEFKAARAYAIKKGWSTKSANIRATNAAKDVTVNFTRAGQVGAGINEVVLFYNAGIQSVNRALRAVGVAQAMPWQKTQDWKLRMAKATGKGRVKLSFDEWFDLWTKTAPDWHVLDGETQRRIKWSMERAWDASRENK
jgi:hypothetical protein